MAKGYSPTSPLIVNNTTASSVLALMVTVLENTPGLAAFYILTMLTPVLMILTPLLGDVEKQ